MTPPIRTSAPGKLFLLGEYAVLDGAPALLTAVDRRVSVTIDSADADHWSLRTPGLGAGTFKLAANGSIPEGLGEAERGTLRVFDSVRAEIQKYARLRPGLAVTIDSTEFFHSTGTKLGLGSSAAVTVALAGALAAAHGLDLGEDDVFAIALAAHRRAQRGTGSGGDVAASTYGGTISYVRDAVPRALPWPDGLAVAAFVTGAGSSTTDLVGRVHAYRDSDAAAYHSDIDRLASLARQAEDALRSPENVMALASEYFDALATLDEHAGAGIVTDRHRRLSALANGLGGVFKTTGAGGDDVGLVFAPVGATADGIASAFAEEGAHAVPLGFGDRGLSSDGAARHRKTGSITQ